MVFYYGKRPSATVYTTQSIGASLNSVAVPRKPVATPSRSKTQHDMDATSTYRRPKQTMPIYSTPEDIDREVANVPIGFTPQLPRKPNVRESLKTRTVRQHHPQRASVRVAQYSVYEEMRKKALNEYKEMRRLTKAKRTSAQGL